MFFDSKLTPFCARALNLALLSVALTATGCERPKSDQSDNDDSDSSDENNEDKKTGKQSSSNDTNSGDMNKPGTGDGTGPENNDSKSGDKGETTEENKEPQPKEVELKMEGEVNAKGQLRFALDIQIGLVRLKGKVGENVFDSEVAFKDGSAKLTLTPPDPKIDLSGEGKQSDSGSLLGTVYDDVNKNGSFDSGKDMIIGSVSAALRYSRPGNGMGSPEWQIEPSGIGASPITEPLDIKRVDTIKEVASLDLAGKYSDLGVESTHLSSLSLAEVLDLKKNFNDKNRLFQQALEKGSDWTLKISGKPDDARRPKEGYDFLPGFSNPIIEFPVGYVSGDGSALKPESGYAHLCIAEGSAGMQVFTPVAAVWIEPGPFWIKDQAGAFLASMYGLRPGWSHLAMYYAEDSVSFFYLGDEIITSLYTSNTCTFKLE